jgi:hypothetical protein
VGGGVSARGRGGDGAYRELKRSGGFSQQQHTMSASRDTPSRVMKASTRISKLPSRATMAPWEMDGHGRRGGRFVKRVHTITWMTA